MSAKPEVQIDWSKGPEGAQAARLCGLAQDTVEFYRLHGAIFQYWSESDQRWEEAVTSMNSPLLIWKPKGPWSGEGLPPVGTVCECKVRGYGEWQKATILAHHNGHAWATGDDGKHCFTVPPHGKFRLIKTPEQISAEKRESTVNDMCHIAQKGSGFGVNRADMYALYDAGYRWVAPEEK